MTKATFPVPSEVAEAAWDKFVAEAEFMKYPDSDAFTSGRDQMVTLHRAVIATREMFNQPATTDGDSDCQATIDKLDALLWSVKTIKKLKELIPSSGIKLARFCKKQSALVEPPQW